MAEKTNREYAQLVSDKVLKYAPMFFKDEHGITVPKTEAEYNARGWLKVENIRPSYDALHYVCIFDKWIVNGNKIVACYQIEDKPAPADTGFEVSKMYLEIAIVKAGLYDKFIKLLEDFKIPLDDDGEIVVSAKFLYDKALVINTKNDMFLQLKPLIAKQLEISEAQIDKILMAARAK